MLRRFSQIAGSEWKPGLSRPIAMLRLSPKYLESVLSLKFEEMEDDLDRSKVAFLKTPGGREFALFRYRGSPVEGTEIWTRSSSQAPRSDLRRALETLGLKPDTVSWTHPDISDAPERRAKSTRTRKRAATRFLDGPSPPVVFHGFTIPGGAKPMHRKRRMGHNPATEEKIELPAKRFAKLRVSRSGSGKAGSLSHPDLKRADHSAKKK